MSAVVIGILGLAAMFSGYRFYSRFIAERVYRLDPSFEPPSHSMRDGVDYVPTHRVVLWGHHFTAVAGAVRDNILVPAWTASDLYQPRVRPGLEPRQVEPLADFAQRAA